jgi:hypothetical protein
LYLSDIKVQPFNPFVMSYGKTLGLVWENYKVNLTNYDLTEVQVMGLFCYVKGRNGDTGTADDWDGDGIFNILSIPPTRIHNAEMLIRDLEAGIREYWKSYKLQGA